MQFVFNTVKLIAERSLEGDPLAIILGIALLFALYKLLGAIMGLDDRL